MSYYEDFNLSITSKRPGILDGSGFRAVISMDFALHLALDLLTRRA